MKNRKMVFWTALVAVVFLSFVSVGCANGGASSPTAPSGGGNTSSSGSSGGSGSSSSSGGTGDVMASSPPGLSAVWDLAFAYDNRLYRADAVHFNLPIEADPAVWASVVDEINGWGMKTRVDLVPYGPGANYSPVVKGVTQLPCGAGTVTGACTSAAHDASGRITGGTMEFTSISAINNRLLVMHEILRTLGMPKSSSLVGILASNPSAPTAEEIQMFLAREIPPLMAVYSPS